MTRSIRPITIPVQRTLMENLSESTFPNGKAYHQLEDIITKLREVVYLLLVQHGNIKRAIDWFTGLSGAGKTTLSHSVHEALRDQGILNVEILDGDVVRTHYLRRL